MFTVLVLLVSIIALAWWFMIFFNRKDSHERSSGEPAWTGLVDDLKKASQELASKEQLESYLLKVHDQVRDFETDYTFLVAFNSAVREIKERLKTGKMS